MASYKDSSSLTTSYKRLTEFCRVFWPMCSSSCGWAAPLADKTWSKSENAVASHMEERCPHLIIIRARPASRSPRLCDTIRLRMLGRT